MCQRKENDKSKDLAVLSMADGGLRRRPKILQFHPRL